MAVPGTAGPDSRNVGAILRVLTAMAMFAAGDATLKLLMATYGVGQVLFLSGLISLVVLVPTMWRAGELAHVRTRRPIGNLLRIAASLAGQDTVGARRSSACRSPIPPRSCSRCRCSSPPSRCPWLGEHVGWRRWGAVMVGFGGVLIITRPGVGALEPAMVLAVGASLGFALMITATRWLSRTERSLPLLLYVITGYTVYGAVLTPFQWVSPPAADLGLFAALGLFYTLGILHGGSGPEPGTGRGDHAVHVHGAFVGGPVRLVGVGLARRRCVGRRRGHGRERPLHPLPGDQGALGDRIRPDPPLAAR